MTPDPGTGSGRSDGRPTRPCDAIVDELARSGRFRDARDLHAALGEAGVRVGLATVYRTLQGLVESGRADMLRLASGTAVYRLCSGGHHHLVCRVCGKAVEVQVPRIDSWARLTADRHGFTDLAPSVELWGVCASCRGPAGRAGGGS